ncbi:MAG: hypothetical protein HY744_31940 [Deltaproteobacteria bacterium]|nr:hypothetical protein [Deltaproteobacteria bacterium]
MLAKRDSTFVRIVRASAIGVLVAVAAGACGGRGILTLGGVAEGTGGGAAGCPAGQADCGGQCVDLAADPHHWGGAGTGTCNAPSQTLIVSCE